MHHGTDGRLLLYLAQKINRRTLSDREYTYAWTAISKLPYLTALALWPKGDCWHGGGLFTGDREVWLNHRPEVAQPHPAHRPRGLRVTPNPDAHGEDAPVYDRRRLRDGWTVVQRGKFQRRGWGKWVAEPPEIWTKANGAGNHRLIERLEGIEYRRPGGSDRLRFSVQDTRTGAESDLEEVLWADGDRRGRLVFSRHGALYAAAVGGDSVDAQLVADLNEQKPQAVPPPDWAQEW